MSHFHDFGDFIQAAVRKSLGKPANPPGATANQGTNTPLGGRNRPC